MLTRVVKVGGSLLDWPPLGQSLKAWLVQQPAEFNVLICGGGALANAIRDADRRFSLGDEISHWLCIDVLSITSRVLAAAVHEMPLFARLDQLQAAISRGEGRGVVFDPRDYLREHEPQQPGRPLAHDWSVTSDSIAARLAQAIGADELVLLKSCEASSGSLSDLAAAGIVDRFFPVAAADICNVRMVNLRETPA
jgi:5-(aminomethyl)-3-furanmethanol phosphate kinase